MGVINDVMPVTSGRILKWDCTKLEKIDITQRFWIWSLSHFGLPPIAEGRNTF